MTFARSALAASAIIMASAGSAYAANVTSMNPQSIVNALQNAGYKALLTKDDDGNPIVDTASDGNTIRIAMSDCEDHKACTTSEFMGVWDCTGSVDKCKSAAAESHSSESPVHVILLKDGLTAVTYSYLLYDDVGISEALFEKNFTTFIYYNSQFVAAATKK